MRGVILRKDTFWGVYLQPLVMNCPSLITPLVLVLPLSLCHVIAKFVAGCTYQPTLVGFGYC